MTNRILSRWFELDSKVLNLYRYLLIASTSWRRRSLGEIVRSERIVDFDENDQTTFRYLQKYGLADNARLASRLFVNDNQALIQTMLSENAYGTLTESVALPHLSSGTLIALNQGKTLEDPLALAWIPRSQKVDYFEAIVRAVR